MTFFRKLQVAYILGEDRKVYDRKWEYQMVRVTVRVRSKMCNKS